MRRCALGVVAAFGLAMATAGAAGAQTPQDSVTLTGGPAQAGFVTLLSLEARQADRQASTPRARSGSPSSMAQPHSPAR